MGQKQSRRSTRTISLLLGQGFAGLGAKIPETSRMEEGEIDESKDEAIDLLIFNIPPFLNFDQLQKFCSKIAPIKEICRLVATSYCSYVKDGDVRVSFLGNCSPDLLIEALTAAPPAPAATAPLSVCKYEADRHYPRLLYVTHLTGDEPEAQLRKIFQPFGRVLEVTLLRDSQLWSKGSALIEMESHSAALRAIKGLDRIYETPGSHRPLAIKFSNSQKRPNLKSKGSPIAEDPARSQFFLQCASLIQRQQAMSQLQPLATVSRQPLPAAPATGQKDPAVLYVGNLPLSYTEGDIRGMFFGLGNAKEQSSVSVRLLQDKRNGISKGFAFVTVPSPAYASQAISQLDGLLIGGKRLKVAYQQKFSTL